MRRGFTFSSLPAPNSVVDRISSAPASQLGRLAAPVRAASDGSGWHTNVENREQDLEKFYANPALSRIAENGFIPT
jgi:hypothetical protein